MPVFSYLFIFVESSTLTLNRDLDVVVSCCFFSYAVKCTLNVYRLATFSRLIEVNDFISNMFLNVFKSDHHVLLFELF